MYTVNHSNHISWCMLEEDGQMLSKVKTAYYVWWHWPCSGRSDASDPTSDSQGVLGSEEEGVKWYSSSCISLPWTCGTLGEAGLSTNVSLLIPVSSSVPFSCNGGGGMISWKRYSLHGIVLSGTSQVHTVAPFACSCIVVASLALLKCNNNISHSWLLKIHRNFIPCFRHTVLSYKCPGFASCFFIINHFCFEAFVINHFCSQERIMLPFQGEGYNFITHSKGRHNYTGKEVATSSCLNGYISFMCMNLNHIP